MKMKVEYSFYLSFYLSEYIESRYKLDIRYSYQTSIVSSFILTINSNKMHASSDIHMIPETCIIYIYNSLQYE